MQERSRLIIVFLKWPEPGTVKTRIARTIGPEKAAQIYRLLVHEVLQQLPNQDSVRIVFSPPSHESNVRQWLTPLLPHAEFQSQCEGGLGDRIDHAVCSAFRDGYEQVIVIGTDCIDLQPEYFEHCWKALLTNDCVFGPTLDGGYYLVGVSAPMSAIFTDIPWSTEKTLEASLKAADRNGLSQVLLPTLTDIDHYEDWQKVASRFPPIDH